MTVLVLPLRRVWPGPVFGFMVLMAALLAQWPVQGALYPLALAIALYTVAATMSRSAALVAAALALAAEFTAAGQGGWSDSWLPVIFEVIVIAAVLIGGLYASTRRAYLAELRDRAERLEREHDQTSALATAVERARIAREMHDSVAHHLTVIVALSDGALVAVNRAPAQATEAIRGVSSTAREALAETRRLLGVLRADGGLELRQPLPGLSDLEGLFTRVRAAGLPVRYERTGPPGDTPPGVQLVVFRLVQEALTNTMKHAGPGASAAVRLRLVPGEVCVEVEDDGAGSVGVPCTPGGGMTGMAERVSAYRRRADLRPAPAVRLAGHRPARSRASGIVISVLLVDDHALIRMGFRLVLEGETDIEVVGEAADGATAVAMCSALRPDVVLMDVRMPGRDGIEATRDIVAAGLPCKVLILTTFDLDDYVYAGLRAGASGFLLKDTQPDSLVAAIHTIAAGDSVLAPTATTRLVRQFADSPPGPPSGPPPAASRPPSCARHSPAASKTSSPAWRRACPTARSRPACSCPKAQ